MKQKINKTHKKTLSKEILNTNIWTYKYCSILKTLLSLLKYKNILHFSVLNLLTCLDEALPTNSDPACSPSTLCSIRIIKTSGTKRRASFDCIVATKISKSETY